MTGAAVSSLEETLPTPARPRLKAEAPLEWGEPDQKTSVHTQDKVVHV